MAVGVPWGVDTDLERLRGRHEAVPTWTERVSECPDKVLRPGLKTRSPQAAPRWGFHPSPPAKSS